MRLAKFLIATAIFTDFSHAGMGLPECRLDPQTSNLIAQNTFKMIPIRQAVANYHPDNAKAYVQAHCQGSPVITSDRLNCEVMRQCSEELCAPIFGPQGTAFLTSGGFELTSAWHVVFPSHQTGLTFFSSFLEKLAEQEQKKTYASLAPSFVLLNHQDEIVYDTRDPKNAGLFSYKSFGDPLTPLHHAAGLRRGSPFGYFENVGEDHVTISLGKSLGVGLQPARIKTNRAEDCAFTAGFVQDGASYGYRVDHGIKSNVTDLKKKTKEFLDFVLAPLVMSRSDFEQLQIDQILINVGYTPEEVRAQLARYSESVLRSAISVVLDDQQRHLRDLELESNPKVFFSTIPASNGQSGGPLFNERGELLGITTNAFVVRDASQTGNVHSSGAAAMLLDFETIK